MVTVRWRKKVVAAHIPIHDDILSKMNVTILKEQLKIRGQKVTGKKSKLLERLKKALKDKVKVRVSKKEKQKGGKKIEGGLKGFAPGARWEPLVADELSVEEPTNPSFGKTHAPTIDQKDAEHVPVKYNFMKYLFIIQFLQEFVKLLLVTLTAQ